MNGIRWDGTITLGTIVQVGVTLALAIMAWSVFKTKVELMLKQQANLIDSMSRRFEEHEKLDRDLFHEIQSRITDLVGGVQRLVGQNEVFRSGQQQDRRAK